MKKKLKENKILFVLVVIICISFIVILFKMFTYFYNGNGKDKYGARLRNISEHSIAKTIDGDIRAIYDENSGVENIKYSLYGKIMYIEFNFKNGISIDAAKEQVSRSLEVIGQEVLSYYDVQFILRGDENDDNFPALGYKNSSFDYISWTNHNIVVSEGDEQ